MGELRQMGTHKPVHDRQRRQTVTSISSLLSGCKERTDRQTAGMQRLMRPPMERRVISRSQSVFSVLRLCPRSETLANMNVFTINCICLILVYIVLSISQNNV